MSLLQSRCAEPCSACSIHVWGWPPQFAIVMATIAAVLIVLPGYALALRTTTWKLGSGNESFAIALLIIAFLLRLIYITQIELLPEDSYYWNYSRHLDFGYLDHPPMVVTADLVGHCGVRRLGVGVPVGALCCAGIASVFSYRLTRNLAGQAQVRLSRLFCCRSCRFLPGGMLMTPDAPLTAAGLRCCIFSSGRGAGQGRAWLWAGVCLGLGLVSKYARRGMRCRSRLVRCRSAVHAAVVALGAVRGPDHRPGHLRAVILWKCANMSGPHSRSTSRRLAGHRLRPAQADHFDVGAARADGFTAGVPVQPRTRGAASTSDESPDVRRRWLFIRLTVWCRFRSSVVLACVHDVTEYRQLEQVRRGFGAVPALAASIVWFGTGGVRGSGRGAQGVGADRGHHAAALCGGSALPRSWAAGPVGYSNHLELVPVGWRDSPADQCLG